MRKAHLPKILLAAACLICPLFGTAQGLNDSLFTVGTTTEDRDEDGLAWTYLLWQSEDLLSLQDRVFAIYSKSGLPDSGDTYALDGVARMRTDPAAILALVEQGEQLGDDRLRLEENIDTLFEEILPPAGLALEDKISTVVQGSLFDPELFENLVFLSRRHPTLSLVMGTGFTAPYSNGETRTWEVRECPLGYANPDNECSRVIARVTLRVGDVLPLPAPGRPVYVPFSDASGDPDPRAHLNVPLRWATPNDLRVRSLLQFGYNIYRMTSDEAQDLGFDSAPPSSNAIGALLDDPESSMTLVNEAPVIIDTPLNSSEAENTVTDPETYFYIDDNDRYDVGGVPFANGDEYFYFVTARDILGRDGEPSEGTPVLICDFQPPPQPKDVEVTNHYTYTEATDTNTQHFKVSWKAPDVSDTQTPESISGYLVYRWWSIDEMQENDAFPYSNATSTRGGLVAVLGPDAREFIDDASNAPFLSVQRLSDGTTNVDQSAANKTFWYTVRTRDDSACGGNLSGNSAPGYGVLRDRIGPPAPTGVVRIVCGEIRVVAPNEVMPDEPWEKEPELGIVYLYLDGRRLDPTIEWVEFAIYDPATSSAQLLFSRYYFNQGETLHQRQVKLPQPTQANPLAIACRMGARGGNVSSWNYLEIPESGNEFSAFRILWEGETRQSQSAAGDECDTHKPLDPTGIVNGIELEFELTTSTEEWKVYRRVEDGNLTMIGQGLDSASDVFTVIAEDLNMPANDTRICYFVQLFDQHGNPSPIVRLGCVNVEGKEELPAPMLAAPLALGDESAPEALLSWFCPPYGVDRFEFLVSTTSGNLPSTLGDDFEAPGTDFVIDGRTWRPFATRRISSTFPGNTPEFGSQIDGISLGEEYTFRVRALGPSGSIGPLSNEETFVWNPDADSTVSGPNVPWPALGLPAVQNNFNSGIRARAVTIGGFNGGSVRIGELNYQGYDFAPQGEREWDFFFPPATIDPLNTVFTNANGESLFPCVLYRYQVPNSEYPQVSGDVYQVSPMMENIPTNLESAPIFGTVAYRNYDPFLFPAQSTTRKDPWWFDLLLKDTQPGISGATYRYLIVRFDPVTKEIAEIIPTNTVTLP